MCCQIRSSPLSQGEQVQNKGTKPPAQIHLDVCHHVLCKWGVMLVVIIVVVYLFNHSLTGSFWDSLLQQMLKKKSQHLLFFFFKTDSQIMLKDLFKFTCFLHSGSTVFPSQ